MINFLTIREVFRAHSSNSALLLQGIAALAPENFRFTAYNGLGDLPHFNPDLDGDDDLPPAAVSGLRAQLKQADAVIICTPEYANGVPGVLKNALDWIVSSGEFMNKPTAVISASPNPLGGDKAHASLLLTLTMMTASIVEDGRLMVPFVRSKVSSEGVITDSSTAQACTGCCIRWNCLYTRMKTEPIRYHPNKKELFSKAVIACFWNSLLLFLYIFACFLNRFVFCRRRYITSINEDEGKP